MVVETKVKSGGVWRNITAPQVKSGGVWRTLTHIYVKSGGVWRTVFEPSNPLNATNIVVQKTVSTGQCHSGCAWAPEDAVGTIDDLGPLFANRTLLGNDYDSNDHTGEWYDGSPTGSLWEIACTSMIFGVFNFNAAAVGTYIDLSTVRIWRMFRAGGKQYTAGTSWAHGNFRIREKADTANYVDFTMKATTIQT